MRAHAGGVFAHVDDLWCALPAGKADESRNGAGGCRVNMVEAGLGLGRDFVLLPRRLPARASGQAEREQDGGAQQGTNGSSGHHFELSGGGPASGGMVPVSDCRKATRSSRSRPVRWIFFISESRYGFEFPWPA